MGRTYIEKTRIYLRARNIWLSSSSSRARSISKASKCYRWTTNRRLSERRGFFQFFSLVFHGVFGRFDVFFDVLDGLVYLREIERLFLVGDGFVFFFDGFRGDVRNADFSLTMVPSIWRRVKFKSSQVGRGFSPLGYDETPRESWRWFRSFTNAKKKNDV